MQFPDSSSIFIYECEKYIRLLLFKKLQSWRGWFRYLFFIIEIRFVNTSWKLINNSFSSEILLFIRFDGYHVYFLHLYFLHDYFYDYFYRK